ncbi:hypothetical protein Pla123a_13240 [Posidoniimonas polymericola]|uniref:Uncharacterized protein n=1 Tax=Posidoniimonas polymericola TaxID=2528002 RepID=A0A5C5YUN0_9BACT|nr:hypothetical protein [Posidoniimonas polymericola]TWT78531.1 hypothetical protein Pla123a_13240 [Posidoniimonas polymericola]
MPSEAPQPDPACAGTLREVVGYLNFSEGASDPGFLRNVNALFAAAERDHPDAEPLDTLLAQIQAATRQLSQTDPAFSDVTQAEAALRIAAVDFRTAYREFHRDLVWHRSQRELWRPFFLARVIEAVLAQGPPWDQTERIVAAARDQLDNYIGYRPVVTLESEERHAPYRHEWVRPIPLWLPGVGASSGPYQELIEQTLAILDQSDPGLLRDAWFDLDLIEELAMDPRAYDFDHPVNKRPNYHFGQWDPDRIDNRGYYRRFILQPIALDALLSRIERDARPAGSPGDGPSRAELTFEAAAVLAGTMLMASGTTGNSPNCHGSEVTLSNLMPHIAAYRDRFYIELLERAEGELGERLRSEARRLRQPFAGARQHLNQELARRRAAQLQHVHLAQLFARMGYPEAADRQARTVRVASARMLSRIYCRLTDGHHDVDKRQLDAVARQLEEIEDLLHRGIECGALVDPWAIIGFSGNYSLFPALENTVHDYRVDELIRLVEQVLDLCSRAWTEAAAVDDSRLEDVFSETLTRLADWWDQFGSSSVGDVRRLVGKEIEVSTNLVAGALNAWHKAGAAAGDVGFWRMFVEQFDTPKAFQLVIEALLDKDDLVSSRALMMQWVSQCERTPLEDGDASFHPLVQRWLRLVESRERNDGEPQWPLVVKFFEHLEASAEQAWHVPRFELGEDWDEFDDDLLDDDLLDELEGGDSDDGLDDDFDEEDDEDELDNLFSAAYDDVTFRDSADDGGDSSIYDPSELDTHYELEEEAERLGERLHFLITVARLWKHTAVAWGPLGDGPDKEPEDRRERMAAWEHEATSRYAQLTELLEAVHTHRIPAPRGTHESLVEYDRRRVIKDALLEQIITTCVEMSDAGRLLRAAAGHGDADPASSDIARTIALLRAVLARDVPGVREHWSDFCDSLLKQELLYVPLGKGGAPGRIVKARALHQLIFDLLGWLPRLGLVRETCQLLDVAQHMEIEHPVGSGAVTEYDRLFENGYQAVVRCLVASADRWDDAEPAAAGPTRTSDMLLVQALQDLTESQLARWLRHSRTVRLSVVEKLSEPRMWTRFVEFVQRYGGDLFNQRFLSLANLRAILHQGASVWLSNLEDEDEDHELRIVDELGNVLPRDDANRLLTLAIEAVVENYREYRDYNSTTTQSDSGELLYAFVDFIRLRNGYDRIAWNLKPVFLAHKILVRQDRPAAAELWRRAVAERTAEEADAQLRKLAALCESYGMRLPSIAERIAERFVRPLTIDRLRGLARPAMQAMADHGEEANPIFAVMEDEIESLMQEPCGAGLDVPDWIHAIEREVSEVRQQRRNNSAQDESWRRLEQAQLSWEELQRQLSDEADA